MPAERLRANANGQIAIGTQRRSSRLRILWEIEVRIAHACRLLSTGNQNIAAVSFDCGFNNLSHFNKQFRLVSGTTPKAYRANLKMVVEANDV